MFWKVFGRGKGNGPEPPMRDMQQLTQRLAVPAVHLVKTQERGTSFIGGAPSISPGTAWPVKDGRKHDFLAQIDLAPLQSALPIDWLPKEGALLFFYDIERGVWGFDPKDRGDWAVIHQPCTSSDLVPPALAAAPAAESGISGSFVTFRRIESLPSPQRDSVAALELSEEESERYYELRDMPLNGQPRHQVAGFPSPVQSDDMELNCELGSHGIYLGDAAYLIDPRVPGLSRRAGDWRLLLQLDTDDDLNMMWGDCGTLYFWVREQDARAGDFSKVWLWLACH
jgi:uncharacterized protein YwqG